MPGVSLLLRKRKGINFWMMGGAVGVGGG